MKYRQKRDRKENEKRMINIVMKIGFVVVFIIGLAVTVLAAKNSQKRNSELYGKEKPSDLKNQSPYNKNTQEKDHREDPTGIKVTVWNEKAVQLYRKAEELEQEMVLLTGGKTGMVMLKEMYQEYQGKPMAEEYRSNFVRKQNELQRLYTEYYSVKKQYELITEKEGKMIRALKNDELYRGLLDTVL